VVAVDADVDGVVGGVVGLFEGVVDGAGFNGFDGVDVEGAGVDDPATFWILKNPVKLAYAPGPVGLSCSSNSPSILTVSVLSLNIQMPF
jgi:hypothetical protein